MRLTDEARWAKLKYNQPEKLTTDDVKDELCDTFKDDMEVETEPNTYEQCSEYVKQVQVKQSDLLTLRMRKMLM